MVFWFSVLILFSQGIEKIAWDNSGERLAVSFKDGDEVYRGLIAIYDTRRTPLISASLMWVLEKKVQWLISYLFSYVTDLFYFTIICFSGFIRGPGDNPKPIAFSFHGKFKQGPLLSVVSLHQASLTFICFLFPPFEKIKMFYTCFIFYFLKKL